MIPSPVSSTGHTEMHASIEGGASAPKAFESNKAALESKVPLKKLAHILPPGETRARLMAYWTTVGVVGALVATMAIPALLEPPEFNKLREGDNKYKRESGAVQFFGLLVGIATATLSSSVLLSTVYYAIANQLPEDADIIRLVSEFSGVFSLPTVFFNLGLMSFVLAVITSAFMIYGPTTVMVIVAILTVLLVGFALIVWTKMQVFSVKLINEKLARQ